MFKPASLHRLFTRIAFGAVAGLMSLAAVAASSELFNQQWGFVETYPDSWSLQQFRTGALVAQAVPPGETLVNCNTTAASVAETKNLSQDDINGQVNTDVMNEKFWRSAVYSRVQNVKVSSAEVRQHASGIKVPEAFASFDQTVEGATIHVRARTTIFITPGISYSITCNAVSDKFDTYSNDFAAAVDSFRLRSEIVAMLSARRPGPRVMAPLNLDQASFNVTVGVNSLRAVRR
jgi:hypothetical protein